MIDEVIKFEPIFCANKIFLILLILLGQIKGFKSILFAQKIGSDLITLSVDDTAMFDE